MIDVGTTTATDIHGAKISLRNPDGIGYLEIRSDGEGGNLILKSIDGTITSETDLFDNKYRIYLYNKVDKSYTFITKDPNGQNINLDDVNIYKCHRIYINSASDFNANAPVYNSSGYYKIAIAFAVDPENPEAVDCNYNLFFSKSNRIWYVHCTDYNSVPLPNIRVIGWLYLIPYTLYYPY